MPIALQFEPVMLYGYIVFFGLAALYAARSAPQPNGPYAYGWPHSLLYGIVALVSLIACIMYFFGMH